MNRKSLILPLALSLIMGALVFHWVYVFYSYRIEPRVVGQDGRPEPGAVLTDLTELKGTLETFDGMVSETAGSWPQFRGKTKDAVLESDTPLAKQWDASGPQKLWEIKLGEGYAGAAVHNGRVYLIDYDMQKQSDAIRSFSLDDGREIWRYSYPVKIKRNHGMSRTVPAVTDEFLVTIGPRCHVTCLDSKTGELKWKIDMVQQFGTKEPLWYAGQCPLIVEDKLILAPAGPAALMIAVDCKTGQTLWTCPNAAGWQMTHCSILSMQFAGKDMYIYPGSGGVAGVDAKTGELLWQTTAWYLRVNVPTPVDVGKGKIFLSAGYNKGSMMLQLEEKAGKIEPKVLFELTPAVFGSDQQTPVFYKGYLYGVRPDEQLVCLDLSGKIVWASGPEHKFGLGPYMAANGMLYVLNDEGLLSLIDAASEKFSLLARAKVLEGHECWGPPALAAGRLLVRDLTTLVCLDVGQ